jgi:hypothetical protein
VTRLSHVLLLAVASCGIAFGPGTREAPAPPKFADAEASRVREDQAEMAAVRPPGAPTVGMSLVLGGTPYDAGSLPKPPIPIVAPL